MISKTEAKSISKSEKQSYIASVFSLLPYGVKGNH